MQDKPIRILQVEDDPVEVQLVHDMLSRREGVTYDICRAASLCEALARLQSMTFDAILLDLTLPDSREINTFQRVRAEAVDTPIIVLSGYGDREFARTAVRNGAQDFLVKGHVDGHLLDCSIRYAIERHLLYKRMATDSNKFLSQERNRVVEETAGGVAHEINQPLTVMALLSEKLLLETNPDNPIYTHLLSLKIAAERIDEIVKQIEAAKVYATRPYGKHLDILDLKAASGHVESGQA
ncbi:MAG: response regulator [bacterium]